MARSLSEKKRLQIVDGARQVFMRLGFDGASMTDIADAAAVSKGTLYNYYASKEDLFIAIMEAECASIRADVFPQSLNASGATPHEILTQIGLTLMTSIVRHERLAIYRIVVAESAKFPVLGRSFENAGPGRGEAMLAGYLAHVTKSGQLRVRDAELAAAQFIALCDASTHRRAVLCIETASTEQIKLVVAEAVRVFIAAHT